MSSDSDVRMTSHERHDPMLVAALAAGDLAGTDRDQAIALTRSCAECRTLHDDLIALARATASVPPPIATRPRDFQLTPADAARLRPAGWRRIFGALSAPRPRLARQAGVAFTTLGLVGLLVGNLNLSMGGSAAAPAVGAPATEMNAAPASDPKAALAPLPASSSDRGTVAVGLDQASSAAASSAPAAPGSSEGYAMGVASSAPRSTTDRSGSIVQGTGGAVTAAPSRVSSGTELDATTGLTSTPPVEPFRPLNLVFIAAIAIGLILLVASRVRRREA